MGGKPLLTKTAFSVFTERDLQALDLYKYSAQDDSYLTYYVMNPFWTWVASFMPPWIAYDLPLSLSPSPFSPPSQLPLTFQHIHFFLLLLPSPPPPPLPPTLTWD